MSGPYGPPQQFPAHPGGPPFPAQPYGFGPSAPRAYGPPAVPPPGWGRLIVECSYTPMAFLLAATGPSVIVDGQHRGSAWGRTVVDLPAGNHHLHVHTRYMGQIGKADAGVHLAPGQLVHLYYRSPLTVFSKGRLGPTPQRSAGMGTIVGIMATSVLVVLLVVLIASTG